MEAIGVAPSRLVQKTNFGWLSGPRFPDDGLKRVGDLGLGVCGVSNSEISVSLTY